MGSQVLLSATPALVFLTNYSNYPNPNPTTEGGVTLFAVCYARLSLAPGIKLTLSKSINIALHGPGPCLLLPFPLSN